MSDSVIRLQIALVEGAQLAQLVDDLRELVGADRDPTDPAITRLTPVPYSEDAEANTAFASATRDDLLDRRALDADVVRAGLAGLRADLASLAPDEAFAAHDLVIPHSDVDAWMRTLATLRLVIATRLGIDDDDEHDPEDERFGVYDWLGYRLELLVQAADALL